MKTKHGYVAIDERALAAVFGPSALADAPSTGSWPAIRIAPIRKEADAARERDEARESAA